MVFRWAVLFRRGDAAKAGHAAELAALATGSAAALAATLAATV